MDKLEHYLDQVCRYVGGPRSLREHLREELRGHLLDAAARYRAAGMPEEEALDRALADFGGPEEVRSGLEATHGHRLLPVVIDKAMQWKERTMRAKWLWASWAYLAVGLVLVLEVLFILFNVVYLVPKYQKLRYDGLIDPAMDEEQGVAWMARFLHGLDAVAGHLGAWAVIVPAVAWGLFEWRVKSENKPLIRLAALGTAAVALMVVVVLTAGSQIVSFYLGAPAAGRMVRPFAVEQAGAIDAAVNGIEQAVARKDWADAGKHADQASAALNQLSSGPALASLAPGNQPMPTGELRSHLRAASDALPEVRQAIRDRDAGRLEAALKDRKSV